VGHIAQRRGYCVPEMGRDVNIPPVYSPLPFQ
jgi:hypothetical protein